jgi:DNA (cytosine-5)-methyltransferase 1
MANIHVTGAFSSNGGEDFRCVLEELCQVKDPDISVPKPAKWEKAGEIVAENFSVAWRTFDAQYWGVPQRRMRIYLVADFDGECASKILFESEGVSGYSAESFASWKEIARSFGDCSEETGSGLMFENHSLCD